MATLWMPMLPVNIASIIGTWRSSSRDKTPSGVLTQCHQRQLVEPRGAQPVGGGERALAAAAAQHDAPRRWWLREQCVDFVDRQAAGAGERRLRRFLEAAQVDDHV